VRAAEGLAALFGVDSEAALDGAALLSAALLKFTLGAYPKPPPDDDEE